VPNQNEDGKPKQLFDLNPPGQEIREGDVLLGHKKGEIKTEGDCGDINEFEYFYL
jgi:hypothetical protein